jgi:tRNA threonylcarbamoyladenosine biosynthesis protein TsaB
MVRTALAEAGFTLAQLDGLAFGAGPGSFTGIRIGCGVAQGLALGAELPVVPVPTLAAVAQSVRRERGWTKVVACLDARMREVYVAAHAHDGDTWRVVMAPAVLPPADVHSPVDGAGNPSAPDGWCGAGNGFAAYPALAAQLGLRDVDADARPTAQAVGELALPRLAAGEGVAAAEALPLYVRHRVALTTAERDRGQKL